MAMNSRLLRPLATGFNPRQIAGLVAWWDAQVASSYDTATGVSEWRDLSGSGNTVTQATPGNQPTLSTINGKTAFSFDGTDDELVASSPVLSGVTQASEFSFFGVSKTASAESGYYLANASALGVGTGVVASPAADTYDLRYGIGLGAHVSGARAADVGEVWGVTHAGNSACQWGINGLLTAASSSGATFTAPTENLVIGNRPLGTSAATFLNATIGSLLIYNRALSLAERQKVEGWLAWRWGLQAQLPSNHPYAYSFPGLGSQARPDNGDALAWESEVYSNSGSVSVGTLAAVNTFANAIDAAGVRDRFYRLNLFAGTGLNAALVPLYRGPTYGGTTYGNATDTNNGPFVSGDYSLASGLAGNGSSKYLDTGYPANTLAASNSHLGLGLLVTDTVGSASRTGIGAWNGGANVLELRLRDGAGAVPLASAFTRYGTVGDRFGDNVTSSPLNAGNITSAWPTMYRNGVASGTVATSSQDFPAAVDVFVLALNNDGSGASNISNARIGYYSIGATMTAVQAASYSDAIDAFYASIGRS